MKKMNNNDNEIISRPFSVEEVKAALFSMKKNKAPGPDNIPIEFYQHCWDIVKNDIMSLFYAFHDGSLDVQRLNYGIITLLPKISEANKISQYRCYHQNLTEPEVGRDQDEIEEYTWKNYVNRPVMLSLG